jgi:hypothetical protein
VTVDAQLTSRRRLLQGLAALGSIVVAPVAAQAIVAPMFRPRASRSVKGIMVYRFTIRGAYSCRACKQHHKYKVFTSRAIANANRAHPGCNCAIDMMRLDAQVANKLFGRKALAPTGVGDLRLAGLQKVLRKRRRKRKRRTRRS